MEENSSHQLIANAFAGGDITIVGLGAHRTRLQNQINRGSFGEVYMGNNLASEQEVAVKLESMSSQNRVLLMEGNIYRQLEGGPGIAKVHWFGEQLPLYSVMIMDLMGPNLQQLFSHYGPHFSLKTVLQLADQMIETIEFIHSKSFVHRDISTNNFLIGLGKNCSRIYLTDFGMAKKLTNGFCQQPVRIQRPLIGTPRFASIAAHRGQELSRKDDLESLVYVLLYLIRGSLPWSGLSANSSREKLEQIVQIKVSFSVSSLCEGLPVEFLCFVQHIRSLKSFDIPTYQQLRLMFRTLADKNGIEYDGQFEWQLKTKPCTNSNYDIGDMRSRQGSTSTNLT